MTTLVKRGDRYQARVRRNGYEPVSRTFIRKADALAWGRQVEADMQAGRWIVEAQAVPSLAGAIRQYRERVAVHLKGARDYAYSFRALEASAIGRKPVDLVTPADLADWRDELTAQGLKPATVARRLGLLSAVLSWCHRERGWLSENPMRSVRKPTVRDARTRTLSAEEVRYLEVAVAASKAKWLPDAVRLLMYTAVRRSELVSLRRSDIDMVQSVARLKDSKNGEAREVPLCTEAKAAMQRLCAVPDRFGRLLPINDPEAISFAFRRAVIRGRARYEEDCVSDGRTPEPSFLVGVRLHDLRHHSISMWANTGVLTLPDLLKISGHRSVKMLARYAHVSSAAVAAKLAAIQAAEHKREDV